MLTRFWIDEGATNLDIVSVHLHAMQMDTPAALEHMLVASICADILLSKKHGLSTSSEFAFALSTFIFDWEAMEIECMSKLHSASVLWQTAVPTLISASIMGFFALPAAY